MCGQSNGQEDKPNEPCDKQMTQRAYRKVQREDAAHLTPPTHAHCVIDIENSSPSAGKFPFKDEN